MSKQDYDLLSGVDSIAISKHCPRPKDFGDLANFRAANQNSLDFWISSAFNRFARPATFSPNSAKEISWTDGEHADLTARFEVNVLKRDELCDVAVKVKTTFNPPYTNDAKLDKWDPMQSYYQDVVSFSMKPVDIGENKSKGVFIVDPSGTAPETKNGAVDYSESRSWNMKSGFQGKSKGASLDGIGLDFSVGHSVSTGSKRSVHDFEIVKTTNNQEDSVTWTLEMKNKYDSSTGHSYSVNDPQGLVIHGAATTWLFDVPDMASHDINPEFLVGFQGRKRVAEDATLYFHFECLQELKHFEILGRGGIRGLRTGGEAVSVPGLVALEGLLALDLGAKTVRIVESKSEFWSARNIANNDVRPLLTIK
ncbi:MAG: hypothetical protein AAFQ98_26280 [Bacteroidota bacterium]